MLDFENLHYSTKNKIAYITFDYPNSMGLKPAGWPTNALFWDLWGLKNLANCFVSGHGFSRAAMPY